MAHGVTTEWDDVQVKMGNYKPLPKVATNDEVQAETMAALEHYDNRNVMNEQQMKELEDEFDMDDDDDFMKQYRAKRVA